MRLSTISAIPEIIQIIGPWPTADTSRIMCNGERDEALGGLAKNL